MHLLPYYPVYIGGTEGLSDWGLLSYVATRRPMFKVIMKGDERQMTSLAEKLNDEDSKATP